MFYRPQLKNGKFVPLNWTIASFRRINRVCWPLEDNAPMWLHLFDRFYYILFICVFGLHNVAETNYLIENYNNLAGFLSGLPAYMVQLELALRTMQLCLKKQHLKKFLKKFYSEIYIEKSIEPEAYRRIQSKLRPTFAYSSTYVLTLILYGIKPIISISKHRRDLLYEMVYPFDITPIYVYLPIVFSNIWTGFTIVTLLYGEANVISEVMLHLNERYLQLNEELQYESRKLLKEAGCTNITRRFTFEVKRVIQKNVDLNEFAAEFQQFFYYPIFIMFSSAALLLCVLCFKVYTNTSESVSIIIWISSKTAEMVAIGEIGSTLVATTDNVSSMYYNCNWELIIDQSTNTQDNIKLMKLLVAAISTNRKPFLLKGLNLFSVSLTSVLKILHGAASYFTFLISCH